MCQMKAMRLHDHAFFKRFLQMSPERFDHLKKLVGPALQQRCPRALTAGNQLSITLRKLNNTIMSCYPKLQMIYYHWACQQCQVVYWQYMVLTCFSFLATGDSYLSLAFGFRVGITTVHKVVMNTCTVLWNVLHPLYLPVRHEINVIVNSYVTSMLISTSW